MSNCIYLVLLAFLVFPCFNSAAELASNLQLHAEKPNVSTTPSLGEITVESHVLNVKKPDSVPPKKEFVKEFLKVGANVAPTSDVPSIHVLREGYTGSKKSDVLVVAPTISSKGGSKKNVEANHKDSSAEIVNTEESSTTASEVETTTFLAPEIVDSGSLEMFQDIVVTAIPSADSKNQPGSAKKSNGTKDKHEDFLTSLLALSNVDEPLMLTPRPKPTVETVLIPVPHSDPGPCPHCGKPELYHSLGTNCSHCRACEHYFVANSEGILVDLGTASKSSICPSDTQGKSPAKVNATSEVTPTKFVALHADVNLNRKGLLKRRLYLQKTQDFMRSIQPKVSIQGSIIHGPLFERNKPVLPGHMAEASSADSKGIFPSVTSVQDSTTPEPSSITKAFSWLFSFGKKSGNPAEESKDKVIEPRSPLEQVPVHQPEPDVITQPGNIPAQLTVRPPTPEFPGGGLSALIKPPLSKLQRLRWTFLPNHE